jgi:hypothetical protein
MPPPPQPPLICELLELQYDWNFTWHFEGDTLVLTLHDDPNKQGTYESCLSFVLAETTRISKEYSGDIMPSEPNKIEIRMDQNEYLSQPGMIHHSRFFL